MENLLESFDTIIAEMKKVFTEKQKMRGSSNVSRQGLYGIITRLVLDKGNRVLNEVEERHALSIFKERFPGWECPPLTHYSEKLEDDLLDMANYCIIALLLLQKKWQ